MKKKYEKPQILFESFELSQSIAAGCEFIANNARGNCGWDTGAAGMLFTESMDVCEYAPVGEGHGGICYDVPNDDSNVFSS